MDLSRRLRTPALIFLILAICLPSTYSRFHGLRQKRQNGANMYLPASSIILGGEGDDPSEWSEWSSPSECSRSCGGGVSYQTRECLRLAPNGAPMCRGGNRKYFSCNTQDCPEDEADFRVQQCKRFNHVPFDGMYYDWVPYTNAPNPCELNCMPVGERFYYRQKEKVADGTRCNDKDLDVCVDGECQPVGCDMMLGSDAKEDKCRKCGGDGSTCQTIKQTFTTSNLAAGYNDILLIPTGATNIRVQETVPSNNYLACRNLTGHYYLNGNWRIDFPRPMYYASAWWTYQRKPNGFAAPDQLTCSGPISESIYIVMLVQDKNVSIDYEYSIPDTLSQNQPGVYTWTHMEFDECSASCGGGTQSRVVTCNNRITLEEVDASLCDANMKPAESQACGQEPCAPHWVEGEWGKCSKGCGADGMQNRTVTCERTSPSGVRTVEEDAVCLQLVGNKPATTQECNRDVKNCPKYFLGPWSPCDKLCGDGKQKRKVTCYIEENGHKKVLPDDDCVEEKPQTEQDCMLTPCEGVDWIISEWSGCTACGQNVETRTAICSSKSGKVYDEKFCAPEVPLLSRPCKSAKCETQWFTSEWSKCSADCGKGVQSRIVICGEFDGTSVTPAADDTKCNAATKPSGEQECEGEEKECPGQWFTGPWAECSKPCGGGERVREVLCLANGTKSSNCDAAKIESSSEKCNTDACTEDEIIPVDSTAKPIEEDDYDDSEECDEDSEEPDVEIIDKKKGELKLGAGVPVGEEDSTTSPFMLDELMQSDAPTTLDETESTASTFEGSGDETDITVTTDVEGSGDETESTTDALDTTGSTDVSSSSEGESEGTEASTASSSSEDTTTDDSSTVEGSGSTSDSSTETGSTDGSSSTDATSSPLSTETTESVTEPSSATDSSSSTSGDTASTESTATDSSTDASSSSSSHDTTDSSASTESATETTQSTDSSTESSSSSPETTTENTESTESSTTDSSTESTVGSSSTDSSTDSSTGGSSSTEANTDTTTDGTTEGSSTTTEISESSSSESSTDGSTKSSDSTTEGSTSSDQSTDSSSLSSDVTDSSSSTDDASTSATTDSGISDQTTDDSTDDTTDSSTDMSIGSTTLGDTESTDASSSTDVSSSEASTTESATESTSESSTDSSSDGSTDVSTDSSVSLDETTQDIWSSTDTTEDDDSEKSTPYTLEAAIKKESKGTKCKLRKKKDCTKAKFGCCPDKKSIAKGPFDEGCPVAKTCEETKYGCCPDGVSPAEGKKNKGCPKSQCAESLFGCCPDKFTAAEGEDNEGCPEPTTLPPTTTTEIPTTEAPEDESLSSSEGPETTEGPEGVVKSCSFAEFGCCPDGKTEATGKDFAGCDVSQTAPQDCRQSTHGCCPDNRTPATGSDGEGCAACTQEPFGCCPDKQTPAHGPLGEGCCLNTEFGCCPDNINSARGPNFEDCDCKYTPYGCCPDKKTAARGPSNEGCSCETSQFGCCPDKLTPANGPKYEGCACHTMQFGCCPDGLTIAQGPHHYGCHCSHTEFKCCPDEKTPAKGPNEEGCTCLESKFGCCPDGVSSAQGTKFEGCENVKEPPQKACGLPKETGSCSNFSIKYFFDTSYGACARFWYGGCEGNDNRFDNEEDCKATCQDYTGKEACYLPKSSGPCTGYNKKWYFDADRQRCEEFNYGGCYGTNNRFDSLDECQSMCSVSESTPPCEQPMEEGPCEGNFERWYYDNTTDVCRPFRYGGCKGNKNNYPTEYACSYHCRQPGVHKDYCSLPKQTGDCSEQHARWYFSESDKKCLPFYYTGCGGNKNNFPSLESCEDHCPKEVVKDVCEIPSEVGECTNYVAMWYFDTKDERCRQFYYGGCGGNDNKFATEEACLQRCEKKPEPEPAVTAPEAGSVCDLEQSAGDCSDFVIQWYYSKADRSCRQFYYGGCGGNGNRFQSREECDQQCTAPPTAPQQPQQPQQPAQPQQPSEQDVCSKPAEVGDCAEYELKWFYNETEASCMQFYYGGCGGNDNRFDNEEECSKRCSSTPDVDTRYDPYPPPANNTRPFEENEKCFLQASFGDCDSNETRWYYNHEEGLCDEFVYSGCGGNSNNFATEDDCLNDCDHVQTTCSLPPARGRCNDNATRWYFDERVGRCFEFEFGGCRGNKNNFVTETECMQFCTNERAQPEPQQPTFSVCELPAEAGECDNHTTAWFYDTESLTCVAFSYSGCGGNGNRFETKEQCDRQCGEFKGIDVCNEPVMTGPCRQWQTRFYYNKESRTCEPFTYGGCDGTGNRFADRAECQSVCIVGNEPQPHDNKDICKLPASVGKCNGLSVYERRWYYDDERGSCLSFIYSGCSGNQNNFRSFEACNNYCGKTEPDTNDITNNEVLPNKCESYEEECRQLRCPYGVRRVAADECTRCQCENPCESYECPEGQQCAVDLSSDAANQFIPVCREINKRGECPYLATNSSSCARECYTDADCRGDNKCCSDGCGFLCVRPTQPTRPTERPTTQAPVVVYPGDSKAALEPKEPEEVNVQTAVGGIAVLRCFATGSPPPNVTWSLHDVVIDTNQGRFVLTSSGDLTIVQVRQTDSGSYVCVASNGLGEPVRREVELRVTEPENKPAYIYGEKNATQIVTLNMPAQIRCPAGGYPAPHVSWWRNRKKLGLVGDRFEQTRDYSLIFRSIQLADLGPYSCEVYNNRGRPSSMTVTLKAVGPARAVNNADAPYLQYIIDPAVAPATQRPAYPYRPTRPSYVPPPPMYFEPPAPQTVSAQAVIAVDPRNTYSPGSAIALSCAVQGSPAPEVTWTKDGIPLRTNERIQITAQPHRLVVNNVSVEDSGSYACTARNAVSYSTSEQTVTIESSLPINPDCVDNPYFANCQLIIKGRYCKNHYYAKFCCRSCTLAGQLGESHPNAV